MAADLRLLLWLGGRKLRRRVDFWLGVVGYEVWDRSVSNRLYGVYLGIFLGIWLLLMWSLAVYESMHVGARLSAAASDQLRTAVAGALPWLVLGGAVVLTMRALRTSPLILDDEDLAYVAASPVSRAAVVLIELARRLWQIARIAVPLATLVTVLLAHRVSSDEIGLNVVPSALVAIPVVGFVWSLAWLGGMLRLGRPSLVRSRILWLVPLVLALPAMVVPAVYRWPGAVLAGALLGRPSAGAALALAGLAAVLAVASVSVGRRASLTVVAVESAMAFRAPSLLELGGLVAGTAPLPTPRAPRRRIALGGRPLLALPRASGARLLLWRAALVTLRQPSTLLSAVLSDAVFAGSGALLIVHGAPAKIWLVWLTLLIMRPPGGLVGVFATDQRTPFLRQFLPVDNLTLLALDSAPALGTAGAVVVAAWYVLRRLTLVSVETLGVALLLVGLLALCQAAVLARGADWDPALARLVFVGLGLFVVLLLGELLGVEAAVAAVLLAAVAQAALIRGGRRVTAA